MDYAFATGGALSIGSSSILLFLQAFMIWVALAYIQPSTLEELQQLYLHMFIFSFAILFNNLFYRDTLTAIGRTLEITKLLTEPHLDELNQVALQNHSEISEFGVLGRIFNFTLVNQLDSLQITSSLMQFTFCVFSFTTSSLELAQHSKAVYMGFILFACNIMIGIVTQHPFFHGPSDESLLTSNWAMKRVRYHLAWTVFLTTLTFIIAPVFFFYHLNVAQDKLGDYFGGIDTIVPRVICCLLFGQMFQLFVMCYGEIKTSHYYDTVQSQSKLYNIGIGMFLLQSEENSNHGMLTYFMSFSIFSILSYLASGFMGFGLFGIGLMCTFVNIQTITNAADIIQSSFQYIKVFQSAPDYQDNNHALQETQSVLFDIQFATKNYFIFQQIILSAAQLLVTVTIITLFQMFSETNTDTEAQHSAYNGIYIIEPFVMFGIFNGAALIYFIQGNVQEISHKNAKNTFKDYIMPIFKAIEKDEKQETQGNRVIDEVKPLGTFDTFLTGIFLTSVKQILFSVVILLTNVFVIGQLFGYVSLQGFQLGLAIVGTHIIVESIITAHQIKNSSDWVENTENTAKAIMNRHKEANIFAIGTQCYCGTGILNIIHLSLVFTIIIVEAFKEDGLAKEHIFTVFEYIENLFAHTPALYNYNEFNSTNSNSTATTSSFFLQRVLKA